MKQPRSRLSLDDIVGILEDVARDGEGADQMRAIKMLTSMKQSGVSIPKPMDQKERIQRLARLIESCGPEVHRLACNVVYPTKPRGPLRRQLLRQLENAGIPEEAPPVTDD